MRFVRPLLLSAVWLCAVPLAHAQTAENVAVVINDNSAASQLVGNYYVRQRRIPASNVVHIQTVTDEAIDRATFVNTIERPIGAAIARERLQDRILYIVLTKGVPLRIAGTLAVDGTMASVDSELTLLYRQLTGRDSRTGGRIENPYFLGAADTSTARRFSHREHDIYLVTHLDAFTVDEAVALIDAASAPSGEGRIVLDQRAGLTNRMGDDWLAQAAEKLRAAGQAERVLLESTPQPASSTTPVLGYASWGATDPQLRGRRTGLPFARGAIAITLAGADARTFLPPPDEWKPMVDPANRRTWFGGAPQSLIGDLIREGATGAAGSVAEPFLQGVPRPEILFPAYMAGFNLAESFYLATPYLSWQTVVIGDPLCAPFAMRALTRDDLDPPIERATELPAFFSARRLESARATVKAEAPVVELLVRASSRLARGDTPGARTALTEALAAAPTLVGPRLQLAMLDEGAGDYDAAIAHYRRIVELQPNNAAVLNNLAYALAVRKNAAAEARPLAERAVTLSRRNATIVDTLGWIEHLLGNNGAASTLLDEAMKGAAGNAEIRLHAAFVAADLRQKAKADAHLNEALRRDPAIGERPEVTALRTRIDALTP